MTAGKNNGAAFINLSGVLTAQAVLNSGLQVDGVLGHSVGEIGALTVSGAISMDASWQSFANGSSRLVA